MAAGALGVEMTVMDRTFLYLNVEPVAAASGRADRFSRVHHTTKRAGLQRKKSPGRPWTKEDRTGYNKYLGEKCNCQQARRIFSARLGILESVVFLHIGGPLGGAKNSVFFRRKKLTFS